MFNTILIWLVIHTILIFVMRWLLRKYINHNNKWWYSVILFIAVIVTPIAMWRRDWL